MFTTLLILIYAYFHAVKLPIQYFMNIHAEGDTAVIYHCTRHAAIMVYMYRDSRRTYFSPRVLNEQRMRIV